MKKKRYSEEQIIGIRKENEAGIPVEQLARKHDVVAGTICGALFLFQVMG